jgi:parvulin-like peptidyl-prolyl isomerase
MAFLVNGERIADETIREEERLIRPRLLEQMAGEDPFVLESRVKEWARENIIERTVLRQQALADPEPVPQQTIDEMFESVRSQSPSQSGCIAPVPDDELRRELEIRCRIDRLMAKITAKVSSPKNKDVSDFYLKHKEEFRRPETVHAAHIVKNVDETTSEEAARTAIEEVAAKLGTRPFPELADEYSDCPGRGGDLGFFPRGEMVDEFDDVVFNMKPGDVSPIFRTQFGFHIATVLAKLPPGYQDLSDVKEHIARQLTEQKRQRAVEQYLDKLMAGAKIEEAV